MSRRWLRPRRSRMIQYFIDLPSLSMTARDLPAASRNPFAARSPPFAAPLPVGCHRRSGGASDLPSGLGKPARLRRRRPHARRSLHGLPLARVAVANVVVRLVRVAPVGAGRGMVEAPPVERRDPR